MTCNNCNNCNKTLSLIDRGTTVTKEQKGGDTKSTLVCKECLPLMEKRNWHQEPLMKG